MTTEREGRLRIDAKCSLLNETNMYILRDEVSGHGILIDPTEESWVKEYLKENELILDFIFLTHEHYDHIAALNQLRNLFPAQVVASKHCSLRIQSAAKNMSGVFNLVLAYKREKYPNKAGYTEEVKPYKADAADITFEGKYSLEWCGHHIEFLEAPGHSKGSVLILMDDKYLFSGDTISYDYELITRLPGGSQKEYETVTLPILRTFDKMLRVYPGHGRDFVLEEIQI